MPFDGSVCPRHGQRGHFYFGQNGTFLSGCNKRPGSDRAGPAPLVRMGRARTVPGSGPPLKVAQVIVTVSAITRHNSELRAQPRGISTVSIAL